MRRLLLLALLLSCIGAATVTTTSYAQNSIPAVGTGQRGRGGQELEKLKTALSLTPGQIHQIIPIFKSTRQQIVQVYNDTNLTPDQRTTQIAQIRKAQRQQIRPLLTQDQLQKYKALLLARRGDKSPA